MTAMHVLSNALTGLGQDAEAADLQLRRLECARAQFATASPPVFLGALFDTLRYLERGGRAIEGERLAREMTAALASIGGGHDDMALESELFLAHFVSMQNRWIPFVGQAKTSKGTVQQIFESFEETARLYP